MKGLFMDDAIELYLASARETGSGISSDLVNMSNIDLNVFNTQSPDNSIRTALIVAGMHRSGTSALTRLINEVGYDLPRTLLEVDHVNNPLGHWESLPIVQLNEDMLSCLGTSWSGFESIPTEWHLKQKYLHFTERAIEVLESEFGHTKRFVIKDPRICRLLPFWINTLRRWGAEPEIVYVTRSPSEVARSLAVRDGLIPALGELVWLRYVLDAEFAGRQTRRMYVSYSSMLKSADHEIARLCSILSPTGRQLVIEEFQTRSQLIRPELRHHRDCVNATGGAPGIWVERVAEIFDRWGANGEESCDQDILDNIRYEFEGMIESYGYLLNGTIGALSATRQAIKRIELRDCAVDESGIQIATTFIRENRLFDAEWYSQRYSDVAAAGVDPATHFVRFGDAELRDPGPLFSTSRYLAAYHDVAQSGTNALVHFIVYGAKEGRAIFPAS